MERDKGDVRDVEINWIAIGSKLWDKKKFIIRVTIVGVIVGLIIAFSIPKEYATTVVFTTDSRDPMSGNMGALASLAGFSLNNLQSREILSPDLYPNIITSTTFIQGLLSIKVTDSNLAIDTTLYSYLKDNRKSPWWNFLIKAPGVIISLFKNSDNEDTLEGLSNRYYVSKDELEVIQILRDSYNINTDKKTGITTFEIATQSPVISAFLADTITSYLQAYIIKERTKKALFDLDNTLKLYDQSKKDYDKAQLDLALFQDRNKNITLARYAINQEKLQNEVNLAYSVYTQMAQQVQVNKIKVQDDTPVFTIIQPAVEPINPSAPKRMLIVVFILFLSISLAFLWILKADIKYIITGDEQLQR